MTGSAARRAFAGTVVLVLSGFAAGEPTTSPATESATRPTSLPTTAASTAPSTSPATEPATAPATAPDSVTAVDPAALPILSRLAAVSAMNRPLEIHGVLTGDFDVAGRQTHSTLRVTGITDGRGHFLHRGDGAGLIVSDGNDAYLFDEVQNVYARLSACPGRAAAAELNASVLNILLDENPALLLSIVDDPAAVLRRASEKPITLEPPGPATSPATSPSATPATGPRGVGLVLFRSDKSIVLRVDPDTGELLGSTIDYTPLFAARHTNGVRTARAVLVYQAASRAMPAEKAFAWHPPVTATEFAVEAELIRQRPPASPASAASPASQPATQP